MLNKDELIDYFKLVNSHAKKELGQNFLVNKGICNSIVKLLNIEPSDSVLEIGPGLGALTGEIVNLEYSKYKVVEYDQKFVEFLKRSFGDNNIEIVKNNFLKEKDFSFSKIIGNIPYYISSEIILKVSLEYKKLVKAVFMVQKECYKRVIAKEGKDYNSLNVLLDYLFNINEEIKVSRTNFFPTPNVDSVVFSITKKPEKDMDFAGFLYKIAKISFQNRRKTIYNNFSSLIKNKEEILLNLKNANIKENARAEELTTEDFVRLASQLYKQNNN